MLSAQDEGLKVRAEADPEVLKALDLLPQAKALADNARKIIAEHNSAAARAARRLKRHNGSASSGGKRRARIRLRQSS